MKRVELHEAFKAEVKALNKESRLAIGQAISDIQKSFGQPHLHSGIGVRKLRTRLYEARTGLDKRLLFEERGDFLFFFKLCNHKEIQNYLKNL